jgi:hypothetical protein
MSGVQNWTIRFVKSDTPILIGQITETFEGDLGNVEEVIVKEILI